MISSVRGILASSSLSLSLSVSVCFFSLCFHSLCSEYTEKEEKKERARERIGFSLAVFPVILYYREREREREMQKQNTVQYY
jgi:amino acid permease